MLLSMLIISVLGNAVLGTVVVFGFIELRKNREHVFKKDSYIRRTKYRLSEAEQEIQRKESIILKEKAKGKWTIQFFSEEQIDKGFFSDKWIIRYRFQLLHNGFPVGPAGVIGEESFREVDKEQVNQVLQDFARPILQAGIEVAVKTLPT